MVPAAPWRSVIDAVVWCHAATPAARDALAPELSVRAGLPLTIGGLVTYREGPVGPCDEMIGAPLLLRPLVAHVPFIAVDSEPSIAGGRGNWALPKVLARFDLDGEGGWPACCALRGASEVAIAWSNSIAEGVSCRGAGGCARVRVRGGGWRLYVRSK